MIISKGKDVEDEGFLKASFKVGVRPLGRCGTHTIVQVFGDHGASITCKRKGLEAR